MITEEYVSFETAKLLKEKGFNEICHSYYDVRYNNKLVISELNLTQDDDSYLAPTQQMTMKWLREVHNIISDIHYNAFCKKYDIDAYTDKGWVHINKEYKTYEEACESAIKYCLTNLI